MDLPAIPCGLMAKSFFNDTLELYKGNYSDLDKKQIKLDPTNIAWTTDVSKFHNIKKD